MQYRVTASDKYAYVDLCFSDDCINLFVLFPSIHIVNIYMLWMCTFLFLYSHTHTHTYRELEQILTNRDDRTFVRCLINVTNSTEQEMVYTPNIILIIMIFL
jgi:hypothetical protein